MKGSRDYYKHGDQNAICDRCGFKFKLSELREDGYGFLVDKACWEPRHPRDMPRIPRVEKTPPKGATEPTTVEESVSYATSPSVPTGTFSGSNA
jgi:hypothetical protein